MQARLEKKMTQAQLAQVRPLSFLFDQILIESVSQYVALHFVLLILVRFDIS